MSFRILTSVGGNNYFTNISPISTPFETKRIVEGYQYHYRTLSENIKWSLVVAYPNTNTSGNSFIGRVLGKNKSKLKQMIKEIIIQNSFLSISSINYNYDVYSVTNKYLLIVLSTSDSNINRASMILGYWNSKFHNDYWNLANLYYSQIDTQFKICFANSQEELKKLEEKDKEYNNLLKFLQDVFKNNSNIKISLEYQNLFKQKFLSNVLVESYNKNLNIPFLEKITRNDIFNDTSNLFNDDNINLFDNDEVTNNLSMIE